MFLSERAIVLFTEYINLSSSMDKNNSLNLTDVKLFIYKKTLGPIILFTKKNNDKIFEFFNLSILLKNIYKKIFSNIKEKKDLKYYFQLIENLLANDIYIIYFQNKLDFLNKEFENLEINDDNIENNLVKFRIKLDIYKYLLSKSRSQSFDIIINKIDLDKIDYNFDDIENFSKSNLYKNIINTVNSLLINN